ncbi:hypothetical protein Focb16_v003991 [Fusarium oxysporum f. sp. cubense]|uniref:Uncharacterized protein n=1 Tax=Fusarium oxysporum f. sp. cubense TaxID=61366 RepID=A0A559KKQ9_FUSOC|nr:hypothetical protein Focb16_v003991 [Fusarium oxysporum f. sp. cubense]
MSAPTTIDISEVMDTLRIVSAMTSARCGANNSTSDSASTSTMRTSETLYSSAKTRQGSNSSSDAASTATMCTSETLDSSDSLGTRTRATSEDLGLRDKSHLMNGHLC